MDSYLQRAEKILSRINELALISEDDTGITRTFGTPKFIEGSRKVLSWMQDAGLKTRIDTIGNVRGTLESKKPDAKTFVIASHIDTVINAGKFDGPLGVILGIDLLENLILSNTGIPFNIELIAFSDEEGVRFHTTYLGSRVVAGFFDKMLLNKKDAAGITLRELISTMDKDPHQIEHEAIASTGWLGYFEIHIEQGPVLYEKQIPVALVTAIAGQSRAEITFKGVAGHAGTVPMNMRNDALCCASEFILKTERFALTNKELVATIGKLTILNSASNVIPGEVICSVDVRSDDEEILLSAYETLQSLGKTICEKRSIDHNWELIQESKPVSCDKHLNSLLAQSIKASNYELIELVSGAGHDAVPISEVAPVAMLFVRCYKGISHNPLEDVELEDMAAAIEVSDNFIRNLIRHNQQ